MAIIITILSICLLIVSHSGVWFLTKKKGQKRISNQATKKPHLIFDLLVDLLNRRNEWVIGNHYITHESGVKLWTDNRPFADMHLYPDDYNVGDNAIEYKKMFNEDEKTILRDLSDKVMRDYKWAHGIPINVVDRTLLQLKNWHTDDPHWNEIQQVL